MRKRLKKTIIYPNRSLEVSKTKAEDPEYMKKQKLSDSQVAEITKKFQEWEKNNTNICKCEKMRCAYCGGRKD